MHILFPKSPVSCRSDSPKGSWWQHQPVDGSKGHVSIKCPECGCTGTLRDGETWEVRKDGTRGHDIAADGTVTPSVVCPHPGCSWHVFLRLDGWTV